MDEYIIHGGKRLEGCVRVHGAKNAVLPVMAATCLAGDVCRIYDCPDLSDVRHTMKILEKLGCFVSLEGSVLTVDSSTIKNWVIPEELMREMRSSIIFLGALTSKMGRAVMSTPGGCELGNRPIDLHIKALRELGMDIREENGFLKTNASNMHSADIHLDFPSVGATENIILSSVSLKGVTTISNAAKEPEISDLCDFLNKMGCDIKGAGTEYITIIGKAHIKGAEHRIIPDRIVSSTLLTCAMTAGGEICLSNVRADHMGACIAVLRESGAKIDTFKDKLYIKAPKVIKPVDIIKTQVYPGFPTDSQSCVLAYLTKAEGTSVIVENVFDARYKIIPELRKMGADIIQDGRVAIIKGGELYGATCRAMDLRGGAALCVASLGAEGESHIINTSFVQRGYVEFDKMLRTLGADITRK